MSALDSLYGADIMSYPSNLPECEISPYVDYLIQYCKMSYLYIIPHLLDKDLRPYLLTLNAINMVPDAVWRIETINKFNQLCKDRCIDDIFSPEVVVTCTDTFGLITDWCSTHYSSAVRSKTDQLSSNDIMLGSEFMITQALLGFTKAISELQNDDARPYISMRYAVNQIPDSEFRDRIFNRFDALCEEHNLTNKTSRELIIMCVNTIGLISDWGINHKSGSIKHIGIGCA